MSKKNDTVYFKGLNGIRAIAAIAVIFSHLLEAMNEINPNVGIGMLDMANFGVTMFFALSGFLITSLLLLENQETKKIHISGFYIRRVLRIWPIYYLYIAITAVTLWLLMKENIVQGDLIYYIFFGANIPFIFNGGLTAISHMWSIGVEEQFYLFWPWLFRNSKSVAKKITLVVISLLVLRIIGYFLYKQFDMSTLFRIVQVNRFDCMGLGGLAAILYFRKSALLQQLTSIPIQIITLVAFILMAAGKFRFWVLVDHQLAALFTALLILANVCRSNPILNLEHKIFNFFGKISYGLYVYHPLVILVSIPCVKWFTSDLWIQSILLFIIAFSSSVLISYLSYQYFEKPFLKLKGRFAIVHSSADAPKG